LESRVEKGRELDRRGSTPDQDREATAEHGPSDAFALQALAYDVREMKAVLREQKARLGQCLALLERFAVDQETIIDLLSALVDDRETPGRSASDSSVEG
jgi:hypothetical protein